MRQEVRNYNMEGYHPSDLPADDSTRTYDWWADADNLQLIAVNKPIAVAWEAFSPTLTYKVREYLD
jgi:hypothetical protein